MTDKAAPKRPRKRKPRCKFGNDTCDGPNGNSRFICRDCVEDQEFHKQLERERDPAYQCPGTVCSFCAEGATCEHGYCRVCQMCREC